MKKGKIKEYKRLIKKIAVINKIYYFKGFSEELNYL
jgi:hypothetical protein